MFLRMLSHVVYGKFLESVPRVLCLFSNCTPITVSISNRMVNMQRFLYPMEVNINFDVKTFESAVMHLREYCLLVLVGYLDRGEGGRTPTPPNSGKPKQTQAKNNPPNESPKPSPNQVAVCHNASDAGSSRRPLMFLGSKSMDYFRK